MWKISGCFFEENLVESKMNKSLVHASHAKKGVQLELVGLLVPSTLKHRVEGKRRHEPRLRATSQIFPEGPRDE